MFEVNDYIIYGLTGVCQIESIRKDEYNNSDETVYYVLQPVYNKNMTIRVPVNNPNVVLRAITTKDDILFLIPRMLETENVWIDDERQRNNNFKTALRTGEIVEWIKIAKALYLEKEARSTVGKKITKTDEDILNTAERYLYEEISIALNISLQMSKALFKRYFYSKLK